MSRSGFVRVLALAAAYKAVEHLFVFGLAMGLYLSAPLLLGALWTTIRPRAGAAVIAVAAFGINLTGAYRNHLALLALVALVVVLFGDEEEERFLLRTQLSVMYGFAAVAKVWPAWVSGEALEARTWTGPLLPDALLVGVAVVTIVLELALAYGAWSSAPGWIWVAVSTHLTFFLFTQPPGWDSGRLATFGVLSVAIWLRATPSGRRVGERWCSRRDRRNRFGSSAVVPMKSTGGHVAPGEVVR